MIKLSFKFNKNGCFYTLYKRDGDVALYELRYEENSNLIGYEVFIVKKLPDCELFGNLIPAHEVCPSNEEFGSLGWSATSLDHALRLFNFVLHEIKAGTASIGIKVRSDFRYNKAV
jgi:hypothetical protein